VHQLFPATTTGVNCAQQLATEAGVGDVLENDIGVGRGHIDARNFSLAINSAAS
jgi:hypothetical protein